MRVIVVLSFLSVLWISSCTSGNKSSTHSAMLKDCLDSSSLQLLDEMVENLETQLDEFYGGHGPEAYQSFVNDVRMLKQPSPPMFSTNNVEVFRTYNDSDFHRDFNIQLSESSIEGQLTEIPPVEGEDSQVYNPVIINPDSKYVKCLTSSADSEVLKELIRRMHLGDDMPPFMFAQIFINNLSIKDYENSATKLLVTTHLYLEAGLAILAAYEAIETRL